MVEPCFGIPGVVMPQDSITPEERQKAIDELNFYLRSDSPQSQRLKFNRPAEPPTIFSATNPLSHSIDYDLDPEGELAALLIQRMYPQAFNRAGGVHVGRMDGSEDASTMASVGRSIMNTPIVYARQADAQANMMGGRHKNNPLLEALDSLRHEFGHVMGLDDSFDGRGMGSPSYGAYNIGDASHQLHKDIELPAPGLEAELSRRRR